MANEIDRKLMPDFIHKSFAISLGCMHKTYEMMKDPPKTFRVMMEEMQTLVTPPPGTAEGLAPKARALAAVWVERGMTSVEECRKAGEKFTGAQ